MLAMSDTAVSPFLPIFSAIGIDVAFLVPTPTGYGKSIMDATAPLRALLADKGIHDYSMQRQGPEAKAVLPAFFVAADHLIETSASLYRPVTKQGDPRIWFSHLKEYCLPKNLLAIIVGKQGLYVLNLSDIQISRSLLLQFGFPFTTLQQIAAQNHSVVYELLEKLREIHSRGFLPSITSGDPGVGDTLEHALGIRRNNSPIPDYKGIELKTTRLTRCGQTRQQTRENLFAKVPDTGLTYREIVERFGKHQIPRGATEPRLQLYETFRTTRINAYGLMLQMDIDADCLHIVQAENLASPVYILSTWHMDTLRHCLNIKHHETFWIGATSIEQNGVEHFRYDTVLYTKRPNAMLMGPLLLDDKISVDLAAHFRSDGSWKDHGMLFKMKPNDIPLLLGDPVYYNLAERG